MVWLQRSPTAGLPQTPQPTVHASTPTTGSAARSRQWLTPGHAQAAPPTQGQQLTLATLAPLAQITQRPRSRAAAHAITAAKPAHRQPAAQPDRGSGSRWRWHVSGDGSHWRRSHRWHGSGASNATRSRRWLTPGHTQAAPPPAHDGAGAGAGTDQATAHARTATRPAHRQPAAPPAHGQGLATAHATTATRPAHRQPAAPPGQGSGSRPAMLRQRHQIKGKRSTLATVAPLAQIRQRPRSRPFAGRWNQQRPPVHGQGLATAHATTATRPAHGQQATPPDQGQRLTLATLRQRPRSRPLAGWEAPATPPGQGSGSRPAMLRQRHQIKGKRSTLATVAPLARIRGQQRR